VKLVNCIVATLCTTMNQFLTCKRRIRYKYHIIKLLQLTLVMLCQIRQFLNIVCKYMCFFVAVSMWLRECCHACSWCFMLLLLMLYTTITFMTNTCYSFLFVPFEPFQRKPKLAQQQVALGHGRLRPRCHHLAKWTKHTRRLLFWPILLHYVIHKTRSK